EELVGQDGPGVLQDGARLPGGGGAHGDEVLLVGGGGDGVHRGRVGQDLVLRGHIGGGVLDDHEAAVDAAVGGEEAGQAVGEGGVDHALNAPLGDAGQLRAGDAQDRKSTRLNSSHVSISYAVFCLKKKNKT